jgi:opacity protein-like surface antigen
MRILFCIVFCFLVCNAPAPAQSSIASASGESSSAASGAAPAAAASSKPPPFVPIRSGAPVQAAKSKSIELGLGYSYVSQGVNQSNRMGLRGEDASFTIGFSRLGIKADVGYAQAGNVLGTGRHSTVLSYLAGPVFHPTVHRSFDTYVQALVGGAKVSGPILTNGGLILLGGWTTGYAWAVGGGVEYWVTDSVAIRTGTDYMRTSFYDSSLAVRGQNNLKTTASVVYYLGKRERRRH